MTAFESSDRFLRPEDLRLLRRNRRQLQAERLLGLSGRILFALLVALLVWWIYQRTQQDHRFAVRSVELSGVQHTSRPALQQITRAYLGSNLFKLDIDRVQRELHKLPWVERVAIEKKLPSTLKITLMERRPVALASIHGMLRYVDRRGSAFAELTPSVGNPDLPLITGATPPQIPDCVQILAALERSHPALFSRVSEISPAGENAYRIFDRDLATLVYLDGDGAAEKWKALYAIANAEGGLSAEYVDLRFSNRIIVKPWKSSVLGSRSSETTGAGPPRTEDRGPSTGEKL